MHFWEEICVGKSKTGFQLSKACTSGPLQCISSATGHFKCKATAWKGASSACWVWKQVVGERGSLSWTSCQEGRTRVEHLHSGHKKTSAFQGGQLEAAGGQRNSELLYRRPRHPGQIATDLQAFFLLVDWGSEFHFVCLLKVLYQLKLYISQCDNIFLLPKIELRYGSGSWIICFVNPSRCRWFSVYRRLT